MSPNRKIAGLDAETRTVFVQASAINWSYTCQTNKIFFSEPSFGKEADYVHLA